MPVLEVKNLAKRYPGFTLEGVSFSLEKGRIMGFIGRNGAGKTTTLKSLLNFVHPDAGEIRFFGMPFLENEIAVKKRIGYVSGATGFYMNKKIAVITDVTRRFYPDWDEGAYKRYLSLFELDERKTPAQLSEGMKVKYALALALSHKAELLLLDEPTSGLDPVSRDDLLDVFLDLAREGASILFSTHITSDLDKCADDITYIKKGRLVDSGDIRTFVGGYRELALEESQITDALKPRLIGCKRAKEGYTALVTAADAQALGLAAKPADLESVMVHMERE